MVGTVDIEKGCTLPSQLPGRHKRGIFPWEFTDPGTATRETVQQKKKDIIRGWTTRINPIFPPHTPLDVTEKLNQLQLMRH